MDQISRTILKILQKKARIPNVEIARQVDMAPSAVLERIRKLEQQDIITGYEVRLNPDKFDRNVIAFISVQVDPSIPENEISKPLTALPDIQEIHYVSGEDGYLLKARIRDAENLGRLIRNYIHPIPGVVSTRTTVVLETIKETAQIPIREHS